MVPNSSLRNSSSNLQVCCRAFSNSSFFFCLRRRCSDDKGEAADELRRLPKTDAPHTPLPLILFGIAGSFGNFKLDNSLYILEVVGSKLRAALCRSEKFCQYRIGAYHSRPDSISYTHIVYAMRDTLLLVLLLTFDTLLSTKLFTIRELKDFRIPYNGIHVISSAFWLLLLVIYRSLRILSNACDGRNNRRAVDWYPADG
mmetsp:Transcript_14391/g.16202  ORF Transcript_14391/g.16202 Transcript_14391/m.16202 type:complete len:200 (-) Transcript_14391:1133-1732(-)